MVVMCRMCHKIGVRILIEYMKTIAICLIPMEYYSIVAKNSMLNTVYSMRYKSYSAEDYIEKNSSRKFMDEYDSMSNCTSYLTFLGKKAIGSIRACVFTPEESLQIPAMEVFEKEIKEHLGFDEPFVESNKFVIEPDFQKHGGVKARFSIFRNIIEKAIKSNTSKIIAAVRPEHIKFYKMLYFVPISDSKRYPHLSFDTVLLVCKDLDSLKQRVWSKTESSLSLELLL